MWKNPYQDTSENRARRADATRARVQQRREEREFLKGIAENYELGGIDEVRERMKEQEAGRIKDHEAAVAASREQLTLPQPIGAQAERVKHFQSGTVKHAVPTQGGATLWCAEADGSVTVRNGVDGGVSFAIERSGSDAVMLFSTAAHVFVGLADGTVRIYDHLVFIMAAEGKAHETAITAFAETFDGKVFSADAAGVLVKRDTEANEFEPQMELRYGGGAVNALATYGFHLFVAGAGGDVWCFDTETGLLERKFAGHTGAVSSVSVCDGYLFTGGSDKTVRVWDIGTGECLAVLGKHAAPVMALITDENSHVVWSADDAGVMHAWDSRPLTGNVHLRSAEADSSVVGMAGATAVDAVKLWTVGSNGVNFAWHAANNKMAALARQAIMAMDHIIEQDRKEIARWKEQIKIMAQTVRTVQERAATELATHAAFAKASVAMRRWAWWVLRRRAARHAAMTAAAEGKAQAQRLGHQYMSHWFTVVKAARQRRANEEAAQRLMESTEARRRADAFRQLLLFARERQAARRAAAAAVAMHLTADRRLLQSTYNRWTKFPRDLEAVRTKERAAEAYLHRSRLLLMSRVYLTWRKFATPPGDALKKSHGATLGGFVSRAAAKGALVRWVRFAEARRAEKHRERMAEQLGKANGRVLQLAAYQEWRGLARVARVHRLEEESRALAAEMQGLQVLVDFKAQVIARRRLVADTDNLVDQAQDRIDERRMALRQLRSKGKGLAEELLAARENRRAKMAASEQELVDNLMLALKQKCLNLDKDTTVMKKVGDRCKTVETYKVFLEAHLAVKRVIIDITGTSDLPANTQWPVTPESLTKIKSHAATAVLEAVKTMILTWEMLTPADHAAMETNQEVSLNADILSQLTAACITIQKKKLKAAGAR